MPSFLNAHKIFFSLAQISIGHHSSESWYNPIFVNRHQFVDYDIWLYFLFLNLNIVLSPLWLFI